jgi:hypothetical protein
MRKFIYWSILLMLFFNYLFLFRNESPVLVTLGNYLSLFILIIGIRIIYIWFAHGLSKFLNPSIKSIYNFWVLMIIWFFLVPIIFFGVGINLVLFYQGMYHDYRYLLFSFLPFMLVGNYESKYFQKIFNKVGFVAVLSGVVAVIMVDKSFSYVSNRDGSWTLSYYLWWVVACAYPYLFLKNNFIKKDYKGLLLITLHLLLSFLFLKRSGFVGALILISLTFIFSRKTSSILKKMLVLGLFILIGISFFGDYLDLLVLRFSADASELQQFDRYLEVLEFLNIVSSKQLLTGFGANNYIEMTYIGIQDNAVNSLHIGLYNIIYKGGILYALFILYLGAQIISLRKYINYNPEIKIGFIIGIFFLISFSYENSWGYLPDHFFLLLAIYRGIYLKDDVKRAIKTGNLPVQIYFHK